MLHPLAGLRGEDPNAEYAAGGWAQLARETFLASVDNKRVHEEGLNAMAMQIYAGALAGTGKPTFLDKTPRYYGILPELGRVFPDAHFIILYRNPIAVMCSILRTWVQGEWCRLPHYRFDLLSAPKDLVAGAKMLGERAITTRFEEFVKAPQQTLSDLCGRLELSFDERMLENKNEDTFAFGDPGEERATARPDAMHSERWMTDVEDPQIWRLASDYLNVLDDSTLRDMGYDRASLCNTLKQRKPPLGATWMTHSLESLLRPGAMARGDAGQ